LSFSDIILRIFEDSEHLESEFGLVSSLVTASLVLLILASASGLNGFLRRRRVELVLSALASGLILLAAVVIVGEGRSVSLSLWSPSPYSQLALHIDALGGVFAAIIGGVGLAASVFGLGYAHHRPIDGLTYPLFLLTMLLTASAANVYTFLVGWEGMALTSFLLVLGDGASSPRRQAAILYLVMTHVATVFVTASFFLVAREAGSTEFAAMSAAELPTTLASLTFVLALAGFGTKAGLIPVHIWLPRAHPVAPSHVSALMSAAMVKVGIYGLARVSLDFLSPGEPWWGLLLIAIGGLSAFLGVLYALMEHDLKRILAFSTVENVGIIALALGAVLSLRAHDQPALAAALFTAALLHSVNHAWFKTLLFLAAGSVQQAAHTLSIDRLGGLARVMPLTSVAALVGCLSIAALPPFNGFAGEWLLFRGLVGAAATPVGDTLRLTSLAAIGVLAAASGLAVACFVRLFGISFLGLPRTGEAEHAREAPLVMTATLLVLAVFCLVTGIGAGWLADWLQPVSGELLAVTNEHSPALIEPQTGGRFSPALLAIVLLVLAPLPWVIARAAFGKQQRPSLAPVWSTGVVFRPSMQYSGTSFSKILRLFYHRILLPEREIEVAYHGASPLPRLVRYNGRVPALFEERLYKPLRSGVLWAAGHVRVVQNGSVQMYLLYMVAVLGFLLVVAR
jgi:hydrogenase-4 component B